MLRKISALVTLLTLATILMLFPGPTQHRIYAQFTGASNVPGFAANGANAVVNAAVGAVGAVTNPAANFLVLVQGGPVYCAGSEQIFGQSTIQLAASTTYQIEWNCGSEQLYAKTAVVLPGGQGGAPGVAPGTPGTFLAPIANVELALATVVCNATACGNGGQGSITDARSASNFPGSGTPLNTSTFANLPTSNVTDGTMIICSSCTQPAAGATCTSGATNVLAVRLGGAWRCI